MVIVHVVVIILILRETHVILVTGVRAVKHKGFSRCTPSTEVVLPVVWLSS